MDEKWFFGISLCIEFKYPQCAELYSKLIWALSNSDIDQVIHLLSTLADLISDSTKILVRMYEENNPHYFYNRVRLYFKGYLNNDNIPNGLYFGNETVPRVYAGGSAAQSPIIHLFDVLLGVKHEDLDKYIMTEGNPAVTEKQISYMLEMRNYIPTEPREFLKTVSANLRLREAISNLKNDLATKAYNNCIYALKEFREKHIQIVSLYVISQSRKGEKERGTGGTDLIKFLKHNKEETLDCVIYK